MVDTEEHLDSRLISLLTILAHCIVSKYHHVTGGTLQKTNNEASVTILSEITQPLSEI